MKIYFSFIRVLISKKKKLALTSLYCLGQETWLDDSWKFIWVKKSRFYALRKRAYDASFYEEHVSRNRKQNFLGHEPKIISKETKDEPELWLNNINIYNGYTFKPRALTTCLIFTGTSDEEYGVFILKRLNKEVCSAKFKDLEKQTSSTQRELLAVKYVLDSFGEMLRNQSVKVIIVNSSACRTLPVGSAEPIL